MIHDSRRRLWQLRLAAFGRILFFVTVVVVVIILLPSDTVARVRHRWENFVEYVKREHGPFYEFFSNKDMDKAMKEYGQFRTKPKK